MSSSSHSRRVYSNIYARLNDILNIIKLLEEDYDKQEQAYIDKRLQLRNDAGFKPGTLVLMEQRLVKAAASIRELRKDAQGLALQHGEEVAVWWAERNAEVLGL